MDAESTPLPRRERRKLELRGRMLEAGVTLFDAQGIEATTVGEICERADVAQKTFFNHFPSKRHLIREIALEGLAKLHLALEDAGKLPGSPRERIAAFFAGVAKNGEELGPLHRELLTEVIHTVHDSGEEPEVARRLRAAFAALVRSDSPGAYDDETRTEMVMGAYYVLMFNWAHLEGYALRERADALASFLGDAFGPQGESVTTDAREATYPGIPNGWFAVAFSRDLGEGEVKRIRYFDEELVLFRTRAGNAAVLSAYCPHLGAHLAEGGRVVGEGIRCPFHAWEFGLDGQCTRIPYCDRIPPAARTRAWDVVERNHMIFVWHHAEQKPPDWDVPEIPELIDPEWTEPRHFDLEVGVHMQEMAENNCDPVHFQYVHSAMKVPESDMEYGEGGRFFRITSTNEHETPMGTFEMELQRDTYSLGITTVRMSGIPGAGLLMFSSTSPIDRTHTVSRWLFATSRNMADVAGEEFIQNMSQGVLQDVRIWENKIHRAQPVFCEGDTYLAEFRRWTKQFYSEPA